MKIFIFFATLSIFLNLPPYYALFTSTKDYVFYFVLMFLISLYYFLNSRKIILNQKLLYWMIGYFIIICLYYINTGLGGEFEYKRFVSVIMIIITFFSFSLLYELDDNNLTVTRTAIIVSMLIAVVLLVYDFIFPGSFLLPYAKTDLSGRAVATYINQNIVGAVLILGLILSIDLLPKKYRFLYIIYIFIGIALTFSRSNIIIYFIILFIMAFQKKISRLTLFIIYLSLSLFLVWLMFWGLDWLASVLDVDIPENLINRLSFFVDRQDADTSDLNERKMVLSAALNMFMEHPILGNGFASTITWKYAVGPHNTFALTWAEFGLVGLLIIPLLLLSSTYDIFRTKQKKYYDIGILFIIYFSLSSMFSHNMLDQTFNYVGAVIVAILGSKNIGMSPIK